MPVTSAGFNYTSSTWRIVSDINSPPTCLLGMAQLDRHARMAQVPIHCFGV